MPQKKNKCNEELKMVINNIARYLNEESAYDDLVGYVKSRVKGQDEAVETICTSIFTFLRSLVNGTYLRSAIILSGVSGSGKTEIYRSLKQFLEAKIEGYKVLQKDFSHISPSSYKGVSIEEFMDTLGEETVQGACVLFLDEADKRLEPDRDVEYARLLQRQILTFVEGVQTSNLNTALTFFIFSGAYTNTRKSKCKAHHSIGFGKESVQPELDMYAPITREDLLQLGVCEELIGRISSICNLKRLNTDAVNGIIDLEVKKISAGMDCEIILSDKFRQSLLDAAWGRFGCREFYNRILESALQTQSKAFMDGFSHKRLQLYLDKPDDYTTNKYSVYSDVVPYQIEEEQPDPELDYLQRSLKMNEE